MRWELKGTRPCIGAIWYLLGMWPLQLYLVYLCVIELHAQTEVQSITVQVLITVSLVAMLLFSVSLFLKLEIQLMSPTKGATPCLLKKYPAANHLLRALTGHLWSLHGLAGLFLMISASLLQLGRPGHQQHRSPEEADVVNATGTEVPANHSESHQGLLLPILPDETNIGSTLLCLNMLAPMILHSMIESDPIWKRARLWGVSYSVILVLASVKFVASSLMFHLLYTTTALTHRQHALFNCSTWVPPLYALSLMSLFMFCVSLKVYMELSCPDNDNPTVCLKLRRKLRPCPSSLALQLTTVVQIAWEVPLLTELYSFFMETSEVFVLVVACYNLGFCLVCGFLCLLAFIRRSCRAHRTRAKKVRTSSGLCLAHSFVYHTGKHGSSTKC